MGVKMGSVWQLGGQIKFFISQVFIMGLVMWSRSWAPASHAQVSGFDTWDKERWGKCQQCLGDNVVPRSSAKKHLLQYLSLFWGNFRNEGDLFRLKLHLWGGMSRVKIECLLLKIQHVLSKLDVLRLGGWDNSRLCSGLTVLTSALIRDHSWLAQVGC